VPPVSDVTRILSAIEQGDPHAAEQLLPLVYDELRRLAAQRMAQEAPGQTLQATALVHEAYLRLVDAENARPWHGRGHFFAAAAEAMRRILVENARRKKRLKHGGELRRVDLAGRDQAGETDPEDLLALDDALTRLAQEDAAAAEVVKLRFYAGLSVEEAAEALGLSRAGAYRHWTYARAWLRCAVQERETCPEP
jgi:RNA polymerase sigma factor (TIGR02999 family)